MSSRRERGVLGKKSVVTVHKGVGVACAAPDRPPCCRRHGEIVLAECSETVAEMISTELSTARGRRMCALRGRCTLSIACWRSVISKPAVVDYSAELRTKWSSRGSVGLFFILRVLPGRVQWVFLRQRAFRGMFQPECVSLKPSPHAVHISQGCWRRGEGKHLPRTRTRPV